MSLLESLEAQYARAIAYRDQRAIYAEAARNRGDRTVERALLDAGMPALSADECSLRLPDFAKQVRQADLAAKRVLKRIEGLRKWQEKENGR